MQSPQTAPEEVADYCRHVGHCDIIPFMHTPKHNGHKQASSTNSSPAQNITTLLVDNIQYSMIVPQGTRVADEIVGYYFEISFIEDILAHLKTNDAFWDVGASTGTHAIPASLKLGKEGIVYAFEPDEGQAELITQNYLLNQAEVDRTAPLQVMAQTPLWDEDTPITLHTSGLRGKAPRVTRVGGSADTSQVTFEQHITMPARTIRSLVEHDGLRRPDILKIDVEGVGLKILQGMDGIRPRHVYLEIHPTYDDTEIQCIQFLLDRGYSIGFQEERVHQIHCRFDRSK